MYSFEYFDEFQSNVSNFETVRAQFVQGVNGAVQHHANSRLSLRHTSLRVSPRIVIYKTRFDINVTEICAGVSELSGRIQTSLFIM
jgi:hypothetical protein